VTRPAHSRGPKPDRIHALQILAASTDGYAEGLLRVHGVTNELIVDLVRDGLATSTPERVVMGHSTIEVARVRTTDAGRQVLEAAKA
jgi:hypothetical protein